MRTIFIVGSSAVILFLVYDLLFYRQKLVEQRLKKIASNQGQLQSQDELDTPLLQRIVKPALDRLIKSIGLLIPVKESSLEETKQKLELAGIHMKPKDYRAMNLLIILAFGSVGFLFGLLMDLSVAEAALFLILGLASGYVYRRYYLETLITNRKDALRRQLPEVLDVLSVSVVAGLSFYQSLAHVVEKTDGPLINEFKILQREISLGKQRNEALSDLAKRCDVDEINSFVSSIIQADELGVSLQNVLETQSEMVRDAFRQAIEEEAAKIPVKILLPMVLFIFPVIFIVLLGPAIPTIVESLVK